MFIFGTHAATKKYTAKKKCSLSMAFFVRCCIGKSTRNEQCTGKASFHANKSFFIAKTIILCVHQFLSRFGGTTCSQNTMEQLTKPKKKACLPYQQSFGFSFIPSSHHPPDFFPGCCENKHCRINNATCMLCSAVVGSKNAPNLMDVSIEMFTFDDKQFPSDFFCDFAEIARLHNWPN